MDECEMLEIKPIIPRFEEEFIEEKIDAGFGPIVVAQQGCGFKENSNQICIVTFHDLGLNHRSNYQAFFNYHLMRPVLNRMHVFHINAPGQDENSEDLPSGYVYPTMDQLADSVRTVCNYYGIKQVILIGVGLGANVMGRVALKNPDIVDALFMINPTPSPAGWYEWFYQKRNIYYLRNLESSLSFSNKNSGYSKILFPQMILDYLVWHHFGTGAEERNLDLVNIFKAYFSSLKIKPKNLASLIESYIARDNLGAARETNEIKCSSFIITGNDSPFLEPSIEMLQSLRPDLSGWMKLFDCGSALDEQPQKVAEAFILFVQGLGLGLLTHVKIK